MNGAQDLGGMQAFGPIHPEDDVSLFHADWERRVLAMTLAMGATGKWNIDTSRAARESLPPAQYLSSSYYEIWFEGLKKLQRRSRRAS
jgi:nitrile hydratase subunit beta